jgi:hypothetical protein
MAMAGIILTAIGDVAAMVAVWFAYHALGQAKETVREARAAREDAEMAAKDAAAERQSAADDRREAERDRLRRRVERVGEIVEDLFWQADLERRGAPSGGSWMAHRNLLRHAMVGLAHQLPRTAEVLNSATADQAFGQASQARTEIELELGRLAGN